MNIDFDAWEKRGIENAPKFMEVAKEMIDKKYLEVSEKGELLFNNDFDNETLYQKYIINY